MRYLGYTSLEQVDRLTLDEYNLLMEGVKLRMVDQDYRIHEQAYLNFAVKAQKKTGKHKTQPIYRTFNKFFDYESAIRRVTGKMKESRFAALSKHMKGDQDVGDE